VISIYKVTIFVNNVTSRIGFPTQSNKGVQDYIENQLMQELSFKQKGYQYTSAYRSGKWDGRTYLYNPHYHTFPTGLLQRVIHTLQINQVQMQVEDQRTRPIDMEEALERWKNLSLHGITLRDYQREAILSAITEERGILDMSTGSGKTEVAAGIIATLQVKTLFIVHLRTLLFQSAKRISERLGCRVAIFGSGSYQWGDVTVASIQSLYRNLENLLPHLKEVQLVIVDEAHHISNNTYFKVLKNTGAYYRFGLSGTPLDRSDCSSLITVGMLGEVIHKTTSSELIRRDLLTKPTIIFIPISEEDAFPQGNENYFEWREVYEAGIVYNNYRNTAIARIVQKLLQKGKKHILVMVKEVRHGECLENLFREYGLHAPLLWSTTSKFELSQKLEWFRNGKISVLISSPIFDEGIDIPEVDAIVLAGGGESTIKTIQRIGRGVRKSHNKQNLVVIDFFDQHHYILKRHSQSRIKACKREKEFQVIDPQEESHERRRTVSEPV